MGEPRPSQSSAVTALALSVTFGDSSPKGRAKGRAKSLPLPLGEVAERSEDGEGILPLPLGEVAERSEDGEGEDGASVPLAERFFTLLICILPG